MKNLLVCIYALDYWQLALTLLILTGIIACLVLWRQLLLEKTSAECGYRVFLVVFCMGVFCSIITIVAITVLLRERGSIQIIHLVPGRMLCNYYYLHEEEALRTLLMNIALFVPLGGFAAALNCCRRNGVKRKRRFWLGLLVILIAAGIFSFGIESAQYLLACGESEADDIICNTLGAGLGWLLVHGWYAIFARIA